jgi:hypothetical protein
LNKLENRQNRLLPKAPTSVRSKFNNPLVLKLKKQGILSASGGHFARFFKLGEEFSGYFSASRQPQYHWCVQQSCDERQPLVVLSCEFFDCVESEPQFY